MITTLRSEDTTVDTIREKAAWMRRQAMKMVFAKKLGHLLIKASKNVKEEEKDGGVSKIRPPDDLEDD